MKNDSLYIEFVDHRISTALILFLLLLLLSNGQKRPKFVFRAGISAGVLCVSNWLMRYVLDTVIISQMWQGIGYGLILVVMSLLFLFCYRLCYYAKRGELLFYGMIALTIYKLAWNLFKAGSALADLMKIPVAWSGFSIVGSVVSYLVYTLVCFSFWLVLKRVMKQKEVVMPKKTMTIALIGFLFCQVLLEFFGKVYTTDASGYFLYYSCALLYTVINYIVLLCLLQMAHYKRDYDDMRNFLENKRKYYEMSRDGITSLQIKCHDLKHQIAAMRDHMGKDNFDKYVSKLEDSIIEYGTVIECGNETINTVLTEKNILCITSGVKFSYLIDGHLFDFMTEMELFSLFGNVLDNALESCSKISEPEKRFISLKALPQRGMVMLHVENYYEDDVNLVDGLPQTTKEGTGHGFGLRSVQQIADKYQGVLSIQPEGNVFKVTVLLNPHVDSVE